MFVSLVCNIINNISLGYFNSGEQMIPDELRKAVAELYLSRYKRIIL